MAKVVAVAFIVIIVIAGVGSAVAAMLSSPAALLGLALASLPALLCVGLALFVAAVFALRYAAMAWVDVQKAAVFVAPDENGLLPVAKQALLTDAGAHRTIDVHLTKATAVPSHINYAPRWTGGNALPDSMEQVAQAFQPETFAQLWQAQKLPSDKILMGYDVATGQPVYATWRQLYSALIGGTSGSGKSTAVRLMLAQSAMQGGQFVIVDPHFESGEESLGASLLPFRTVMPFDVASEESQMIQSLKWVEDVGRQRLKGESSDRAPLVLIVDEVPGLLEGGYGDGVKEQLKTTLSTVVRETRKVNVYAFAIGQSFQAQIMPSKIRNSFASMVGCSLRKDEARYMSGNSRFASAVDGIVGYQAVWMNPQREIMTLAVPNCTEHDITLVASHLSAKTDTKAQNAVLPPGISGATAGAFSGALLSANAGANSIAALDAKAMRALEMTAVGATQVDIIAEVWGVTGKGTDYKKASAEYRAILGNAVGRIINERR